MVLKISRTPPGHEERLGTSMVYGGEPSINGGDSSKFDIAKGEGNFVDNYTDPENPVIKTVKWNAVTGATVTNIATQLITFLAMDSTGTVIQQSSPVSSTNERDLIPLGVLRHENLSTISLASPFTNWGHDALLTLADLYTFLGPRINVFGNVYEANGANLFLDKTVGEMSGIGINYGNSKKYPNSKTSAVEENLTFFTVQRSGAGPIVASTDSVPNTQYDPNGDGVLVDIPAGYFTTHRIFLDPSTEVTLMQYGQFVYDSLKKAATSWEQEAFDKDSLLIGLSLRSIVIIQKDATELDDPDLAKFIDIGLLGDKTFNIINNFSNFAENIEIIDGMSYQRPSITFVNDGGTLYADVESVDATDITYVFGQREFILDCTTGSGVSGRARIALTAGTATVPLQNYIYVVRSGETAVLNASTTFPTGQFAWMGDVLVPSATTFDSVGVYSSQRYSDNKSHDGRGALSYEREKIRALGTTYESGIVPTITITDLTPDTLDFATTSGEVYQLHKSAVPALDSAVDGIFVINHPTTPWLHVTALGDIQVDANGDTLNNKAFNFVFVIIKSSANGVEYSHLGVLLPTGSYNYNLLNAALADEDSTAVTSVPSSIKKTTFLVSRVTLKYKNDVWNNVTEDETATTFFDLRGSPLGATSGGAGTPSVTAFSDDIFSLFNLTDPTKLLKFDASGVTTGQTRTFTVPDNDGVLATVNNLLGTTNQVTVTDGGDTATFSLPQDIHTAATPTFGGILTTGTIGSSGADIADGVTATTQAPADNSTLIATTAYADAAGGDGDVVGPGSSTDNALARFDSTTGKLLQNSVGILTDAGALSGLTLLDVDNININGNTISATDSNGDIILLPDGTGGIGNVTDLTDYLLRFERPIRDTINQEQTSTTQFDDRLDWWQSFTPDETGNFTRVDWYQRNVSTATGTMYVYEGEGTGGSLLTTEAMAAGAHSTWHPVSLTTPVAVTSGQKYTFRFVTDSFMKQAIRSVNLYAGGRYSFSASWDAAFKAYVDPGFVLVMTTDTDRIGINTLTPTETLDVNGNITASGNINADGNGIFATVNTSSITGLTSLDIDNINIDGNTISSTDTDGNLLWIPDGDGAIGNSGFLDLSSDLFRLNRLDTAVLDVEQATFPQFDSRTDWWQSFTAGTTGYLTRMDWYQRLAATGTGTMSIYSGEGTGGSLLTTEAVVATAGGTWHQVPLSTIVEVVSGQKYTFRMVTTANFEQGVNTGNPYAGGRYSQNAVWDAAFRAYVAEGFDFVIRRDTNRVGIGITAPTEMLHVAGNINISSGSVFKIDGTEVLSATALGAAISISKIEVDTTDVSNPPTDAELDSAFGAPATVGAGFVAFIDDNAGGANFYQVASDGTNWWISTFTKAV